MKLLMSDIIYGRSVCATQYFQNKYFAAGDQKSALTLDLSRPSQCSTTGVTKTVVCANLSVGWCM